MFVHHIVNVSGGKDSTATYLLAMEYGKPFRAIFCDTGNEHPITLEYIARLSERTGGPAVETYRADFAARIEGKRRYVAEKWPDKGVPPEVIARALKALAPTGVPFLDLCLWKGRFPSRKAQFCTEELKTNVAINQVILPTLRLRTGPVCQWLGVRGDESAPRSKLRRFERDDPGSYLWRPIHRKNVEWVFAMHRKHGIEPNPLYLQGMGRVGCMPCINCQKDEILQISDRFPEHIDKLREWEWLVGEASKHGLSSFFSGPNDPTYDETVNGGKYTIDRAVAWSRTSRGGRSYDLMKVIGATEPSQCVSKYGLCE